MSQQDKILEYNVSSDPRMWKLLGANLYESNPIFPITVRELLQNSHDAQKAIHSDEPILFTLEIKEDGSLILTCQDNGIGMDIDTIHDKFLVLGSSGKQNGVGGFGVAKSSILCACSSWDVHTRDNLFTLEMFGKQPIQKTNFSAGCKITLGYAKKEEEKIRPSTYAVRNALRFLATSDVKTKFVMQAKYKGIETTINIEGLKVDQKRLIHSGVIGKSNVIIHHVPRVNVGEYISLSNLENPYKDSDSLHGRIIYRLNGLTQYISYAPNDSADFNAVVDISTSARPGDDDYPFTISREGISSEISDFVIKHTREMFVNHLSTQIKMKEKTGKKRVKRTYYEGNLFNKKESPNSKEERERRNRQVLEKAQELLSQEMTGCLATASKEFSMSKQPIDILASLEQSPTGIKTLIVNTDKHRINKINCSRNVKRLQVWTEMISLIMEANPKYQHPFGIGFVLDNDYSAVRENGRDGVTYYLLNCLKTKVSKSMDSVFAMFLDACHEITHTLRRNHDEDFTVAESEIQRNFLNMFGVQTLYTLARHLRVGHKKR